MMRLIIVNTVALRKFHTRSHGDTLVRFPKNLTEILTNLAFVSPND